MKTVRHILLALSVALISGAGAETPVASVELNIPEQPMQDALNALAQQTGLQVVFAIPSVQGTQARKLQGKYTPDEALRLLLEDKGLSYKYLDERTIAIQASFRTSGSVEHGSKTDGEKRLLAQADTSSLSQEESQGEDQKGSAGASGLSEAEKGKISEIIVTVRKAKERLQDVPASVTAISGDQLKERGAVDLKDVLGSVPGLSFSNVDRGQAKYTIRGIANGTAAPTVGVYLDDISLVTDVIGLETGAFDAVFFDIDRLEVLKGPQGTLYGGSAMGGAIKYVTARPNLSEFSSSAAVGVGTTAHGSESYNAEGIVNVPLVADVLAIRGGFSYLYEGGYIDNVANLDVQDAASSSTPFPTYTPLTQPSLSTWNKKDYNVGNTYSGRLSLLWQPDPSWSIRPAIVYQDYKLDNPSLFFANLSEETASYRQKSPTRDRDSIYSLDITKKWGAVELTSVTAYFERRVVFERDLSFAIGTLAPALFPVNSLADYPHNTNTFSQELRLASAPGSEARLSWVGGLYYASQKHHSLSVASVYGVGFPGDVGFSSDIDDKLDQYAAFGEATYRITNALDFTAGMRLFRFEDGSSGTVDGPFAGGFSQSPQVNSKQDGVNPKFGFSYKLNDDHLLYVSAAKGFRPGRAIQGANITNTQCAGDLARLGLFEAPTSYDSDTLWSYEVGSKNGFEDGRTVINGSLFYNDWKEIQQRVELPSCAFGFTTNAGHARVKGAEIEAQIVVTPALRIGGTATFTDAKIVEAVPFTPVLDGDETLDTPEWMASAYGSYSFALNAAWDLHVRTDYQYRGEQRRVFFFNQAVTFSDGVEGEVPYGAEFQDAYAVVNASASFSKGPTVVRLYANNVLNERPQIDTRLNFGDSQTSSIRPRTIGLEVRRQF